MANDNNNINELVPSDDDPTVELEVLSFGLDDAEPLWDRSVPPFESEREHTSNSRHYALCQIRGL